MSVTVIDHSDAIRNATTQKVNIFLRIMCDEIVNESTPKTPKSALPSRGSLRRNVVKSVLGLNAKIVWGMNYAAIQELVQHQHYTTPGTSAHFAENAVRNSTKSVAKVARMSGLI